MSKPGVLMQQHLAAVQQQSLDCHHRLGRQMNLNPNASIATRHHNQTGPKPPRGHSTSLPSTVACGQHGSDTAHFISLFHLLFHLLFVKTHCSVKNEKYSQQCSGKNLQRRTRVHAKGPGGGLCWPSGSRQLAEMKGEVWFERAFPHCPPWHLRLQGKPSGGWKWGKPGGKWMWSVLADARCVC